MNKERDLLPWVLGAVSATAVAAISAVSYNRSTPPAAPTPMVAAQSSPAPVPRTPAPPSAVLAAVAAAPEPDPTAPQSLVQTQTAPESSAPSAQIWQCTTRGVKTFSSNPCGEKSTLLEVGPINTMNPASAVHYARAYTSEPRYAPAYSDSESYTEQESYSDQGGVESGGNSYAIIQGVGFVARRRPEHPHHRPMPPHHNSGPTPRALTR
jgi:hypothetical protein